MTERAEPSEAADEIYVGLEHIDPQDLHIRRWGKGSDVIGTKLRFGKGNVIVARRRAYQRKLCSERTACCGPGVARKRTTGADIVEDIDDIVKKVRFDGWQATSAGERLVQKELRRTLLKYKLHTDQELFEGLRVHPAVLLMAATRTLALQLVTPSSSHRRKPVSKKCQCLTGCRLSPA